MKRNARPAYQRGRSALAWSTKICGKPFSRKPTPCVWPWFASGGGASPVPSPSSRIDNPEDSKHPRAMSPGLLVDAEQWAAKAAAVLRGDLAKQVEAHFLAKWEQVRRRRAASGVAIELRLSDIEQAFIGIAAGRTTESPVPALRSIDEELSSAAQASGATICAEVLALIDRPGQRLNGALETLAHVESRLDSAAAAMSAFIDQMEKNLDRIRRLVSEDKAGQLAFRELSEQEAAWHREYCKVLLCENVYRRLLGCVDEVCAATKQLGVELNRLGRRLQGIEERVQSRSTRLSRQRVGGDRVFPTHRPQRHDSPGLGAARSGIRRSPANQSKNQTVQPPQW